MPTHLHPVSGVPIEGIRLGPGAEIHKTDQYASSDGKWRPAPCAGSQLQAGCETVWIRSEPPLPPEGRQLLGYLLQDDGFGLTQRSGAWIVVPSERAKYDGRIQWDVRHPGCAEELVSLGLVPPTPVTIAGDSLPWDSAWPQPGDVIYYPTDTGREAARERV